MLLGLLSFCTMTQASIPSMRNTIQVKTYALSNGMQVWVNEDPEYPMVFGAVVVKAGSKDCPNTGIAHYFEHIMFKGTDKIGTLDFAKERPLLEEIEKQYDTLKMTTEPAKRKIIQKKINELSIRAADFAIPNEFNQLLSDFGGTNVNAFTGFDMTSYFNFFMPQYTEPWMRLYSDRLIHPVFRLFQSELETVYEEKNMYSDNFGQVLMERALYDFFEPHPYAYPVIGSTENLKNPDFEAMHRFFKDYYVGGNLALIISGNIKADQVIPLAERYFGRIPAGEKPKLPIPALRTWNGTQERSLLAPIPIVKARAQAWRTVPKNHPDEAAIAIAMRLLSNANGTGYLDMLTQERKVMVAAGMAVDQFNDMGVAATIAVPKLFFQSQSSADKKVQEAVDKIKQGAFSEAAFQSAKLEILKENTQRVEDPKERALTMMFLFSGGESWEQFIHNQQAISKISKEDVMRVANQYFGSDKMTFTKKFGKYPKDSVTKPGFDPIVPKHKDASSEYATELRNTYKQDPQARFVDIEHQVNELKLSDETPVYVGKNPYNDIFNLSIRYAYGFNADPLVGDLPAYLGFLGTSKQDYKSFQNKLRSLGATLSFKGSAQHFTVVLNGFDDKFEETLALLEEMMHQAAPDKKAIASLSDSKKVEAKASAKDNAYKAKAMLSYLLYRENSAEIRKRSAKEIGKLKDQDFLGLFQKIQEAKASIQYTGSLPEHQVQCSLEKLHLTKNAQALGLKIFPLHAPAQAQLYLLNDKDTRQSIIQTYVVTPELKTDRERLLALLLNDYIGGSMSSLLFQEIREFRSLAYRANSSMQLPPKRASEKRAVFNTVLSTQTDKTAEALDVLMTILKAPDFNQKRFERAKLDRYNIIAAAYPSFRELPEMVAKTKEDGYQEDPQKIAFELLKGISLDDLKAFYQEKIASQFMNICLYTNAKTLDLKQIQQYGNVVKLQQKTIMK